MTLDYWSTTVDAAAAWAREDADDDRPTLGECVADEAPVCGTCGLRPTWADEGDPCDECEAEA